MIARASWPPLWLKDELHKITEADDLHVAPFRAAGDDVRYADVDREFQIGGLDLLQTRDRLSLNATTARAKRFQHLSNSGGTTGGGSRSTVIR